MNKLIWLGIFSLLGILILLSGCGGEITSPNADEPPRNLDLVKVNDYLVEISWTYDTTDSDTIYYHISKKIGNSEWTDEYDVTENKYFADNIETTDSLVYAYKVLAENVPLAELSPYSETVAYFSPLTAPTETTLVQTTQTEIELTWKDNCIGEEGFYIDKKINDENWVNEYKELDENIELFTETIEPFSTITYRVSAFSGKSSSDTIQDTIFATLAKPTNLLLTSPDPNKIKLSWDDNSEGETNFAIDRLLGSLEWELDYALTEENATSWFDDIEEPCGTFIYRVRAYNDEFTSEYSEENMITMRLQMVGSIATPGDALKVHSPNWSAFVADNYGGLAIIDCSNPTAPGLVGTPLPLPDRTLSVHAKNGFAYATSHTGSTFEPGMLSIIDVSNLSSPNIVGSTTFAGIPNDIYISGDHAFIADGENGLSVMYIATSTPAYVSNISVQGDARNVFIENNYAYVSLGLDGMGIVEYPNYDFENPIFKGRLDTNGLINDLHVQNDIAYIANGEYGLSIINVQDKENPYLVSSFNVQGFAYGVFVSGDYAYLIDKDYGLLVINVSNPSVPYLMGFSPMDTQPVSISVSGSYAYITDSEGLKLIQVAP